MLGYLSSFPFVAKLRAALIAMNDADEIVKQLQENLKARLKN